MYIEFETKTSIRFKTHPSVRSGTKEKLSDGFWSLGGGRPCPRCELGSKYCGERRETKSAETWTTQLLETITGE